MTHISSLSLLKWPLLSPSGWASPNQALAASVAVGHESPVLSPDTHLERGWQEQNQLRSSTLVTLVITLPDYSTEPTC